MYDDLSEDAILAREELEDEVWVEQQKWQRQEEQEESIAIWEQDYYQNLRCWPESWMYDQLYRSNNEAC